ncbi:MAG TPA: oligosaccharide flippase family protein [Bacteroidota bacterium]|nr:oligosaccharide flippase family protein [Bacteroidota bacterium]
MMRAKLVELGKDTAIYGLSTILGRLLNFLIVPLYANILLPAENGIVANLYAYIAFVFVFYTYGMEQAYMRFVSSLDLGDEKQNFSVPFLSLFGTSLIFSTVIHLNASFFAQLIGMRATDAILVRYAAWILFFDTLCVVPFASFRMKRKAHIFAILKLVNIVCTLLLNIVFLLGIGMHTEGVFLANLIASMLTFLFMVKSVRTQLTFRFPKQLYRQMLSFGVPYIPSGIASMAMQVIDRPIVKAMTNDATLGLYQLNYRLGIFMMLVVGMFDYAWRPFFLTHAKEPDAPKLFSRVFTYFTLLMSVVFLVVSLFIDDLVRLQLFGKHFFPPMYWQGTLIVPIIMLGYMFSGFSSCFVVGIYIEKKTYFLPLITGAGAIINVVVNVLLIPVLNITGAALATAASYIVMAVSMYFVSRKFYTIQYEWRKVFILLLFTGAAYIFALVLHLEPLQWSSILYKVVIICFYCLAIISTGIVSCREVLSLFDLFSKAGISRVR